MADCDIAIIGGGVIGNAVAYELSKRQDGREIFLLERNASFPGENQTSRNSGVVHAGIYYDSSISPLKADLCVRGNEMLYNFCRENDVPAKKTGKLVVATNPLEERALDELFYRATQNKVSGVARLSGAQSREIEPNVYATKALYFPTSGIVEPTSLVRALRRRSGLEQNMLLGTEVLAIEDRGDEFVLRVNSKGNGNYEFSAGHVVNAAGLYSDQVARMVNPSFPLKTFPVRGESAKFCPSRDELRVSGNVYPTPVYFSKPDGTRHLTVGVHLTPTFGPEITVGPLNRKRGQEIGREDFGSDLAPTQQFLEEIRKFFPQIRLEDLSLHQTGIQAVLENSPDFHICPDVKNPKFINLVGISSPGLTSSLAIAQLVGAMIP